MRFNISKTSGGTIDFLAKNEHGDYFIDVSTIEELVELTKIDGPCVESSIILHNRSDGLYLEIYDDYRE